jgi:hypothetical protein
MPSQPTAKKVLKMKRNAAATIPGPVPPTLVMIARITIEADMPAAPNNMSGRRPYFSMHHTAIQDARKYSVPLAAARIRDVKPVR